MNPYLIDLCLFQISWYSIFILAGLFVGGVLMVMEAKKFNINVDYISNFALLDNYLRNYWC